MGHPSRRLLLELFDVACCLSFGDDGGCGGSQTFHDTVAAQDHHGVEERRRDSLSYDGDARGIDE
jgi:hypothetical protein